MSSFNVQPYNQVTVTAPAHGFVVGDIVTFNGSTFTKAIATPSGYSERIAVVTSVIDTATVAISSSGALSVTGVVSGAYYFLSQTVAGAVTATRPTSGISLYVGQGVGSNLLDVMFEEEAYTSGGGASSLGIQSHTSGSSVTVSDTVAVLYVNPVSVITALSVTLPTIGYPEGSQLDIIFGGTLAYPASVVDSLTVSAPAGLTVNSSLTPTNAISGDRYSYSRNGSVWKRII